MALTAPSLISSLGNTGRIGLAVFPVMRTCAATVFGIAVTLISRKSSRDDVYNILWAVVFGFATLNILSLAARRFEPTRRGLSFGELLAVMVVFISIFLLGWEMLNLFHIFPIKLRA